jgi:hypothetical protein
MQKSIAAEDYNRIRLGLLNRHLPWHVKIGILEESTWVCVDQCQQSLPLLAWTHFKTAGRHSLDAPVECELRLYHMSAGLVMGTALEALAESVADQRRPRPGSDTSVRPLKG